MLNAIRGCVSAVALSTAIAAATVLTVGLTGIRLVEAYDETEGVRAIKCAIPLLRDSSCPDRQAELSAARDAVAQAEEDKARAEEDKARIDAERRRLQEELDGLKVVENIDKSVSVFSFHKDAELTVVVATKYKSLVPPDADPAFGCYIALSDGEAGESRHLWFKRDDTLIINDPAARKRAGISDATWNYAQLVCRPTLLGSGRENGLD